MLLRNDLEEITALTETSARTDFARTGNVTKPYFRDGAWRYMDNATEHDLVPSATGLYVLNNSATVADAATHIIVGRAALAANKLYEVWASVDNQTYVAHAKVRTTDNATDLYVYADTGVTAFNIEIDFITGTQTDLEVRNNSGASQTIKYRVAEINIG